MSEKIANMEAHREAFQAVWRAAVSAAYAKQVMRGWTVARMAERIGWTEAKMRRLLLVPPSLQSISTLSELCWSMGCEPEMRMIDGQCVVSVIPRDEIASAIEAQSVETVGLDPKDESAAPHSGETP